MWRTLITGVSLLCLVSTTWYLMAQEPAERDRRAAAVKEFGDGNFRDAYELYRQLALDKNTDPRVVGEDLRRSVDCLRQLNRNDETDALREEFVELHADNWRALHAAAVSLLSDNHYGMIVAGEFHRGSRRGGGEWVNASARDRVQAWRWLNRARTLAADGAEPADRAMVDRKLIECIRWDTTGSGTWQLQIVTDLEVLPDYQTGNFGYRGWRSQSPGAPVDAEGQPVFYHVPASYEESRNDGERWRWLAAEIVRLTPDAKWQIQNDFASFLHSQFGVQTMAGYLAPRAEPSDDDDQDQSGPYAVHTLDDTETIARLATGIKRFTLPDEFNFVKLYREIADAGRNSFDNHALEMLAQIYTNRRQFPRAAEMWQEAIRRRGNGNDNYRLKQREQIVGNWGRFESTGVFAAGQAAEVPFRFRNATRVSLTARRLDAPLLLEDVKKYIKELARTNDSADWRKLNISDIGRRVVVDNETRYLKEQVATWDLELQPLDRHRDDLISVATPLQKAGAYLLEATVEGGNTARIVVWVSDLAIVQKPIEGTTLYHLADAVTGAPIETANLEFFGYQQRLAERRGRERRYQTDFTQFAESTDADGMVFPDPKIAALGYQWLVIARTADRFAFLGFDSIPAHGAPTDTFRQQKVYVVTDRPVYRPSDTVKYKIWVRSASYDDAAEDPLLKQTFQLQIHSPQGDKLVEQEITTDEFGGYAGELTLDADATLGQYSVQVFKPNVIHGMGQFRVEEYKKPEYEVTVEAPAKPVRLGETIPAVIKAEYFFGAPVTKAKVHYKVTRQAHDGRWYPIEPWDWFYGGGYWWFGYDYDWYPGWTRWGCFRPTPPWWPQRHDPPEVVMEDELEIGPDGTVTVNIDTAPALAAHGDQDHRYEITAEVVDQSRRTIVGTGSVLVAREAFKVFVWPARGYYEVGDTAEFRFRAQTLDQKPVQGDGVAKLFKITYDNELQPVETEVQSWEVDTDARGDAMLKLTAAQSGQYRLSYTLTDDAGRTAEGAYVFLVRGPGLDTSAFRFNALELVTDKKEYQPGETVQLLINTNRADSTVVLFPRSAHGVATKPVVLRIKGKSTVYELKLAANDMPNVFVEAFTISDGQLHTQAREIIVPPAKRIVNVAVEPSAAEYLPGTESQVTLKFTDEEGRPFSGSTLLTVYDKSVEYISGGPSAGDIREFFWKWRRTYYESIRSSLQRSFSNLLKPKEVGMSNLGIFGEMLDRLMLGEDRRRGAVTVTREAEGKFFGGAMPEAAAMMDAAPMAKAEGLGNMPGAPAETVEPAVRSDFADTAFWATDIQPDADGLAVVDVPLPDSLTTWKIRTWTMGAHAEVGEATAEIVTTKNVIVRLQAPRFFTQTDEVVISAIVHNYLDAAKQVQVALELDGNQLTPLDDPLRTVEVAAGGEYRVDWRVQAIEPGDTTVRVKALTDVESDAMEMTFPVYVHGLLKTESFTGVVRKGQDSAQVLLDVPAERRINDTRLEVRYSPTLAGAMVDALPYLADYPYGCTEQTLNRFLPTVITQNILKRMNLDLQAIRDKRTNLNAQEIGDDRERAAQWQRFDRNPVFDEDEVARMVKEGVRRLTDMQNADGGWGWFSGYGERSYPHTTAVVVHGLQIAQANGVALVPGMLDNGITWLKHYQDEQIELLKIGDLDPEQRGKKKFKTKADNLDALVFMVLTDAGQTDQRMDDYLYRDRVELALYAKSLYGLALHTLQSQERLTMIVRNIDQFLVQDEENETAYLNDQAAPWWYWYGSEVEANAFYLKLLAKTDPQGIKASRLVKYLLNNRKHSTYWNSTRDSAYAIEALAEYLVASGEDRPDMTVEVWLDGKKHQEVQITADNLFTFDNKFVLVGDAVESGRHTLELRRSGSGPLYFNAYLTNFTLEDFITKAGLEVKVQRKYYKLTRDDRTGQVAGQRGQVVAQQEERYIREEIPNLAELTSGDLVEIELEIDSKNDYEYLVFEDHKAAGFEPVSLQSGYTGGSLGAYMELRDEKTVFFLRQLLRGQHSVSYRLRAEIPGRFSALPTTAAAMYAPELRANSDEIKLRIADAPVAAEE